MKQVQACDAAMVIAMEHGDGSGLSLPYTNLTRKTNYIVKDWDLFLFSLKKNRGLCITRCHGIDHVYG